MEILVKELLLVYGPLALGWIVAFFLGWLVLGERKRPNGSLKSYQEMLDDYHEALVSNTRAIERLPVLQEILDDYHEAVGSSTRAMERLAVLFEERTRRP